MIRVVIDLNIIISALITRGETIRKLMKHWQKEDFEIISSPGLITELEDKLHTVKIAGTYDLSDKDIDAAIILIKTNSDHIVVPPQEHIKVTGDPEDDYILATAKVGGAHFIITGDNKLKKLGLHAGIKIVSPREFLDILSFSSENQDKK